MSENKIIPFIYDESPVRVIKDAEGNPIWVAKDVARALGYSNLSNPARLYAAVPEEWKGVNPIHTPSGTQEMITLSEQGLYFFLGRSDKPAALPFQKWLAGEVLPSIRKTGAYATKDAAALNNATILQNVLAVLERVVAVMERTVDTLDRIEERQIEMGKKLCQILGPAYSIPESDPVNVARFKQIVDGSPMLPKQDNSLWSFKGSHRLITTPFEEFAKTQMDSIDPQIKQFVMERIIILTVAKTILHEIYIIYRQWCLEHKLIPLGRNTFYLDLRTAVFGYAKEIRIRSRLGLTGVKLRED